MPVSFNDVTILVSIFVAFFMALVIFRFFTFRPAPQKKPIATEKQKTLTEKVDKEVLFEFSEEFLQKQKYEEFTAKEPPVPWGYGDTRITAMYRDPYWIYTYWELNDDIKNEVNNQFGPGTWENSRPVLRVYNVTANNSFDTSISYYANNHYLEVMAPNQSFYIDLGRILPDGAFYRISRSNLVTMPRDSISDVIDKNWPPLEFLYEENFGFGDYTSPGMDPKQSN